MNNTEVNALAVLRDAWLTTLDEGRSHDNAKLGPKEVYKRMRARFGDDPSWPEASMALAALREAGKIAAEGRRYHYVVTEADSQEHMKPLAETYSELYDFVNKAFMRHGFDNVFVEYDNDENRVSVSFPAKDMRNLLRFLQTRLR